MSADENKLIRKNVNYSHPWVFTPDDFQKWKRRFDKAKKNWHMKYTRDSFTWYNHNCIRKKKKCKYSKSGDNSCRGKMKIPVVPKADELGFYRIELTEDGFEHFVSEFEDDDDDYKNFIFEFFKEVNSYKKNSEQPSTVNASMFYFFYPSTSGTSVQSQSDQIINEFAELSERMKSVRITQPRQIATTKETHPPEIISVSEDSDRIQWAKVRSSNPNLKMVIARCTVGLDVDKDFYYNYRAMISLKFLQIGVYHHFFGGQNSPTPEEQFQFLKKILENAGFDKKDHLIGIAVQTEYNADADPVQFTANLSIFVDLLLKNGFMLPIIYCNNNSWKKLIDTTEVDEQFSKLPLWIAHYTQDPNPEYPETWKSRGKKWWMWQYSDKEVMEGMINPVYCSRRNKLHFIQDKMFRSAV
uniref:Lysozyme n=1 Tax=Meloidogyne floridensis TaxID=298350 RepID=A0A915NUQ9_9BILA